MAKIIEDTNYTDHMQLEAMKQVQTPRQGRILTYWIGGIFLVILLCLFLPWTQNISSQGTLTALTPQDRPQTVESVIAGRIEQWYIMEGTFVNKGDTIASLSEIKEKYMDPNLLANLGEQLESKQGVRRGNRS